MAAHSRICRRFLGLILFFSFAGTLQAQEVTGSSSISVDASTNLVTATCETDLDGTAQDYYEAVVHCDVFDGYGNAVAQGYNHDNYGNLGYAIAVVTFTGTPGTTYIAQATHSAIATLGDYAIPPPGKPAPFEFLDEYYFGFYESQQYTYPDSHPWYGPGPPVMRRRSAIVVGGTKATRVFPIDTALLTQHASQDFAATCDTAFRNVIGSAFTYTKTAFFESLLNTTFFQYPFGTPNIPTDTYGSELNLPIADTLTEVAGRPIRLFPNFYGGPPVQYTGEPFRKAVVTHEGIHHYTGWGDSTVFTMFYNSGLRNYLGGNNTEDISVWINRGCPNPYPNLWPNPWN